jgi:hypothetical protein
MSLSDCIQSRHVTEPCDVCRKPTKVVHLPNRPMGFFCEDHCPVCAAEARNHSESSVIHVPELLKQTLAVRCA